MGNIRRIRVRGKPRAHPDAALVAEAIIQLGRELWAKEQARRQRATRPDTSTDQTNNDEAQP